jgi:myo-inositol-1(or 4)-monophosphatase
VACGRLDGFYEEGLQPWDWAAAGLVAAEAGAVVTDLAGEPPSAARAGRGIVAAGPALAGPLLALVSGAGATP